MGYKITTVEWDGRQHAHMKYEKQIKVRDSHIQFALDAGVAQGWKLVTVTNPGNVWSLFWETPD